MILVLFTIAGSSEAMTNTPSLFSSAVGALVSAYVLHIRERHDFTMGPSDRKENHSSALVFASFRS